MPADDKASLTIETSLVRDSGCPFSKRKRGPLLVPRLPRQSNKADTGHNEAPVRARTIVMPLPN